MPKNKKSRYRLWCATVCSGVGFLRFPDLAGIVCNIPGTGSPLAWVIASSKPAAIDAAKGLNLFFMAFTSATVINCIIRQ